MKGILFFLTGKKKKNNKERKSVEEN